MNPDRSIHQSQITLSLVNKLSTMLDTEGVLDAATYPHILDAILDEHITCLYTETDPQARRHLFALRRLNRATRDRVDARLAYRFVISRASFHPAYTNMFLGINLLPSPPKPVTSPPADDTARPRKRARVEPSTRVLRSHAKHEHIPSDRERRALSLLRQTRVYDSRLSGPDNELWMWDELLMWGPKLFASLFPNVQVVRFLGEREARPHAWSGTVLPPAVSFRHLKPTSEGHATHYRADPVPTSRLVWSVSFQPSDIELHFKQGGRAWVQAFYTADETEEFVYLFVLDHSRSLRLREGGHVVRPRTGDFVWGDYRAPSGALGVLEDLVFHMVPELERRHVLVGLESMPPEALELDEGLGPEEVFKAVRAGIRTALIARRDKPGDRCVHADLWPDSLVDTCVNAVRIITLDEYRKEVGEEQFAWETRENVP